jgi:hypothetical protein
MSGGRSSHHTTVSLSPGACGRVRCGRLMGPSERPWKSLRSISKAPWLVEDWLFRLSC